MSSSKPEAVVAVIVAGSAELQVTTPHDPKPVTFAPGDNYWLRVWPDGLEQVLDLPIPHGGGAHAGSPVITGALDVTVTGLRRDGSIRERTKTLNRNPAHPAGLSSPPGAGWELERKCSRHSVWRRIRRHEVVSC